MYNKDKVSTKYWLRFVVAFMIMTVSKHAIISLKKSILVLWNVFLSQNLRLILTSTQHLCFEKDYSIERQNPKQEQRHYIIKKKHKYVAMKNHNACYF